MKLFPRRYYLALLMAVLCLLIFGFTEKTQAANSGKGWYQNFFSSSTVCGEGEWTAEINVFTTESVPLSAKTIEIRAVLWEEDEPTNIYNNSFSNTSAVVVCIPAEGSPDDLMALDVRVSKNNYKDLWSYQRARPAGSAIANITWTRNIYLAQNSEPVNIAHSFPVNNQIVSGSTSISFEIDALLKPGSSQVSEIIIEAINETNEHSFVKSFAPPESMIEEGVIVFPAERYWQGRYLWRVRLMEDENNFLYPNLNYDQFILDTHPPILYGLQLQPQPLSAKANIIIDEYAQDTLSGLKKIEIYLDNVLKKTCSYNGTTLLDSCSTHVGVLGAGTFTAKAVAEDMGGSTREMTRTFVIGDKASLTFKALVGNFGETQGIEFYHSNGFGSGNTYETTYTFESPKKISTTARVPTNITYEGEPYQFWAAEGCNQGYHFAGDYVNCGAKASAGAIARVTVGYSNAISVSSFVIYGNGDRKAISVDIKNISGTVGDFKEGETKETNFIIKSYDPVEATLQAPASISLPEYYQWKEVVFSYWWKRQGYPVYGCNSVSGRNCYIKADPLHSKWLEAYYVPAPNRLEVFSFVNGKEAGGAKISKVAGTGGTGGKTKYLVSKKNGVIDTTLKAPSSHGGETFIRWTGCDSQDISQRTCNIRSEHSGTERIAANFGVGNVDPSVNHTLTVIMTGTGDDSVFVDPPNVEHSATEGNFSYTYPAGLYVDLRAIPGISSSFVWGGDCLGETTDTCVLTMDSDKTVTVDFESITYYNLTVDSTDGGEVTVPGEGTFSYASGTVVNLVAVASTSYEFVNWTGDVVEIADVNGSSTTITMNGDYSIRADFAPLPPPVISNFDAAFDNPCVQSRIPNFSWDINTTDFYDYEIQICSNAACGGGPLISDPACAICLTENTTRTEWAPPCSFCCDVAPYNNINFGLITYSGQVRARYPGTGAAGWSSWETVNFTTYNHCYPWADFDWAPKPPSINQEAQFSDISTCYDIDSDGDFCDPSVTFSWVFPGTYSCIDPAAGCESVQNPEIEFLSIPVAPSNEVKLEVTDSWGYGPCDKEYPITVTMPLPEYREVSPTTRLDNFLGRLSNIFVRF